MNQGRVAIIVAIVLVGCGTAYSIGEDAAVDAEAGGDADADVSTRPDGGVICGTGASSVWCDPTTQYCEESGFTASDPLSAKCIALPAGCLEDRSCACLIDAAPCGCVLEDSGILLSGCFEP